MEYRRFHELRADVSIETSSCRVFFILLLALVAIAQPDQEFSYDLTSPDGPLFWDGFCNNGTMQSPINIHVPFSPVNHSLPVSPDTKYVKANASLYNDGYSPEITGPFGNFTIGTKTYNFDNIHFHLPSEHTLNSIRYQLEMHIVHRSADNETAVLAVFFALGAPSPFLSQFFNLLPQIEGHGKPPVLVPNLKPSFTISGKYARYLGSLTTPPCTEGVIWTVMLYPNTLSNEQLHQYLTSFPDESARSPQPKNGRVVQISPPRVDLGWTVQDIGLSGLRTLNRLNKRNEVYDQTYVITCKTITVSTRTTSVTSTRERERIDISSMPILETPGVIFSFYASPFYHRLRI